MFEEKQKQLKTKEEFDELQNAVGFFSTLLETVLENPELHKKVFNDNKEKNG